MALPQRRLGLDLRVDLPGRYEDALGSPILIEPTGPVKFVVVDKDDNDAYTYANAGAPIGGFALVPENHDVRDVATNADGSRQWVLDKNKNVYVYGADGTPLGSWKADKIGSEPEGITVDGGALWTADRSGKVYWWAGGAGNTTGTYAPTKVFDPKIDGNVKGIVTDGTHLWVVTEGGTDYVYRFMIVRDAVGTPTGLTQDGRWTLATANSKPTGITLDPTGTSQSLWVVDEATDTVYEYGAGREQSIGAGVVTSSFKLDAANTAPQGIADPAAAVS